MFTVSSHDTSWSGHFVSLQTGISLWYFSCVLFVYGARVLVRSSLFAVLHSLPSDFILNTELFQCVFCKFSVSWSHSSDISVRCTIFT